MYFPIVFWMFNKKNLKVSIEWLEVNRKNLCWRIKVTFDRRNNKINIFFNWISVPFETHTHTLTFSDQDNTSLIVSVAVPFALFLAFCLIVSILYVRRKRYGGRRTTKESRASDNMSLPDSEVEISRKVYINNFSDHFRLMSADSDFRWVGTSTLFLATSNPVLLKLVYLINFSCCPVQFQRRIRRAQTRGSWSAVYICRFAM